MVEVRIVGVRVMAVVLVFEKDIPSTNCGNTPEKVEDVLKYNVFMVPKMSGKCIA